MKIKVVCGFHGSLYEQKENLMILRLMGFAKAARNRSVNQKWDVNRNWAPKFLEDS